MKSIRNQTIKNIEIILVDNKSSDNTLKIAKSFGVKKILTINKFLPGAALNKGCNEALGRTASRAQTPWQRKTAKGH